MLLQEKRQLAPCSLHSSSSLSLPSQYPVFFSFFPLVSWLCLPSSLEILLYVSINPCKARILDTQLLPVPVSSSELIPAVFIPSSGGSFHTFLFPVSLLLPLRPQPGSQERVLRKQTERPFWLRAAMLDTNRVLQECCGTGPGSSASGQSCALTLLLCPHLRRCSCTAASSCAGRWTRPRAAPRAAGDACAGRPSNRRSSRTRNLFTCQTTS